MAAYADEQGARALGLEGLSGLEPDALIGLLDAASRMFDRTAEVPDDYFAPAPSVQTWQANFNFTLGARAVPTDRNSRIYEITTDGGNSGALEPDWPEEIGATVADAALVWTDRGYEGTERVFYGEGTDFLALPPYVPGSLGAVTLPDGYAPLEFIEQPGGIMRAAPTGSASVPLSLMSPAGWHHSLHGVQNRRPWDGWPYGVAITVTARWGFLSTPGDVRQAVIQIAAKLYRENDPAFMKIQELDAQIIREQLPPMAAGIAAQWKRRAILFDIL